MDYTTQTFSLSELTKSTGLARAEFYSSLISLLIQGFVKNIDVEGDRITLQIAKSAEIVNIFSKETENGQLQ
jgi:DNA-binding IclR family transcriptional regulator